MYVGQSINIERRWSEHRSEKKSDKGKIRRAISKHGASAFTFEVLETCKPEHLDAFEAVYIRTFRSADIGYNIQRNPLRRGEISDETRRKIADANRGRKRSPESIEKTASALRGRKQSPEACARIRAAAQTRTPYVERYGEEAFRAYCQRMSEAMKGRVFTQEHRDRIGAANKGNTKSLGSKKSPQAIEKTASAHRGKKRSDETRAKQSAFHRQRLADPDTLRRHREARSNLERDQRIRERLSLGHSAMAIAADEGVTFQTVYKAKKRFARDDAAGCVNAHTPQHERSSDVHLSD